MKELKMNINDHIKVKLTDYGKRMLEDAFSVCEDNKNLNRYTQSDENGYTKFQMWDFIQLLGEYMILGQEKVIETEILICVEVEN